MFNRVVTILVLYLLAQAKSSMAIESFESPSSSSAQDMNDSLIVSLAATIENINRIDTHNLVIETTVKLNLTWYDDRLKFRNLPRGREKLVKPTVAKDL